MTLIRFLPSTEDRFWWSTRSNLAAPADCDWPLCQAGLPKSLLVPIREVIGHWLPVVPPHYSKHSRKKLLRKGATPMYGLLMQTSIPLRMFKEF